MSFVVEDAAAPLAFVGGEADLLTFTAQKVEKGIFNAMPTQKIDDGNGHLIPNPAFNEQNICHDIGCD